jgi:hypothetical protein
MDFRIGLHLGDVIVEGEDTHGDVVNFAARLEGIAEPGGITKRTEGVPCPASTVNSKLKTGISNV